MTRTLVCVLLSATALSVAGCQDRFTRQRYETIYIGQPAEQVERTLGKPDARVSNTWTYIREDPFRRAIIRFEEEQVVDKSWYDEQ